MRSESRGFAAVVPEKVDAPGEAARPFPEDAINQLRGDMKAAGGPYTPPAGDNGQVGLTMFDTPGSEDDTIPILLHRDNIARLPSQAMVRIKSRDGRLYL